MKSTSETKKDSLALEEADTQVKISEAAVKLAEAESTRSYVTIRKLVTLVGLLEADRPMEGNGIGSETIYTPCLTDERTINIIENKIIELVKTL